MLTRDIRTVEQLVAPLTVNKGEWRGGHIRQGTLKGNSEVKWDRKKVNKLAERLGIKIDLDKAFDGNWAYAIDEDDSGYSTPTTSYSSLAKVVESLKYYAKYCMPTRDENANTIGGENFHYFYSLFFDPLGDSMPIVD